LEARRSPALVAEQVLVLHQVQVGDGDRAADRVAAEGDAVQEGRVRLDERLGQTVADEHPAERRVARRHALGEGDHVGPVPEAIRSEPLAEAPERSEERRVGKEWRRRRSSWAITTTTQRA